MFVFGWGKEVLRSSNRDRYFKNLSFENDWDPFLISDFQVRGLRSWHSSKWSKVPLSSLQFG